MERTIQRYPLKELTNFAALSPVSSNHFCSSWTRNGAYPSDATWLCSCQVWVCVNGGVDRERKWRVKREGEVEMALEAAPPKVINN